MYYKNGKKYFGVYINSESGLQKVAEKKTFAEAQVCGTVLARTNKSNYVVIFYDGIIVDSFFVAV